MDATLKAGLQAPAPTTFSAVEFVLPGSPEVTVRLCSGGIVSFDGKSFKSLDPVWGALDRADAVRDGVESTRTTGRASFLIPDDDALALLLNVDAQGAPIRIWQGAVNRTTGAALGDTAELLFEGLIDTGTLLLDGGSRVAVIGCTTRSEYQQYSGESWRLSDAWHQSIWPGELGLAFTGLKERVFWRSERPRGAVTGGGGGGGGGIGGRFDPREFAFL